MRFVIRKGGLSGNLFLTPSRRWGRLEKARTFTEKQVHEATDALATNNYGIFDLGHAKQMARNESRVKSARTVFQHAGRLLENARPRLRVRLLGPGQTPQGIIRALGPFEVKDASQIGEKGFDVISDHAHLNFRTSREAEAVCVYLNDICKKTAEGERQ
jgi:hypothetical protein